MGTDPGFNADLRGLYLVKTAFEGDEEMTKIYEACAEYAYAPEDVELQVKRWYNPRARDVEEDSEDEMEEGQLRGSRARVGRSEDGAESKKVNPAQLRVRAGGKSGGTLGFLGAGAAGYVEAHAVEDDEDGESEGGDDHDLDSEMISDSDEEMMSDDDD